MGFFVVCSVPITAAIVLAWILWGWQYAVLAWLILPLVPFALAGCIHAVACKHGIGR